MTEISLAFKYAPLLLLSTFCSNGNQQFYTNFTQGYCRRNKEKRMSNYILLLKLFEPLNLIRAKPFREPSTEKLDPRKKSEKNGQSQN